MKHTREQIAEKVIQLVKDAYGPKGNYTEDSKLLEQGDCIDDEDFTDNLWREYPEILKEIEKRSEPSFQHQIFFGKPGTIAACIDLIYNSPANK